MFLSSFKAAMAVWREERAQKREALAIIGKYVATGPPDASLSEWKRAGNYLIAHMEIGKWWWWKKRHELWFFHLTPDSRCTKATRELLEHGIEAWHVTQKGRFIEIVLFETLLGFSEPTTLMFDTKEGSLADFKIKKEYCSLP